MPMEFKLDEKKLPVLHASSLPNIHQDARNLKVTNYFNQKGRKLWKSTSLTVILKTPTAWNPSFATASAGAIEGPKQSRGRLPQLIRQSNAQRAKDEDDRRLLESATGTSAPSIDVSYVENCFQERLFPYGINTLPKQLSQITLSMPSRPTPQNILIDSRHNAALCRCAILYAVACQYLQQMDLRPISLHRSTFCRFVLDCKLAHANKLPYVEAIDKGFEQWKRVGSGGVCGGIGREVVELAQFAQSIFGLIKRHYDKNQEYFFSQEDPVELKVEKHEMVVFTETRPTLRAAEEMIPYCKWVDEKYSSRCEKLPTVRPSSISWQRWMVRNMLIEPGVIHLITSYHWIFTSLFEAYAVHGHVTETHFLRFCKDFELIPDWGAQQLYVSAYRNSECRGAITVQPDHRIIQKMALRSFHDQFPPGFMWERAWQKLFGSKVNVVDYDTWMRSTSTVLAKWGTHAKQLSYSSLGRAYESPH